MKKTIVYAVMALLMVSFVMAQPPTCGDLGYDRTQVGGVGSIDTECQAAGFDFGIVKYECGSATPEEGPKSGYTTSATWAETSDCTTVDWTSNPAADGILSKEGTCYQDLPGGSSGTVGNIHYGISHITLCGNEVDEIPEFTTIGAGLVLLFAGLYAWRKRR